MKALRMVYGGPLAVLLVVALAAVLGACGVDAPGGTTTVTRAGIVTTGTATIGLTTCTTCHGAETTAWLLTRHGNANAEPAGTESFYLASCKACHEPNGEGSEAVTGATGTAPRVGCEACHGGGSLHIAAGGTGPIGFAATVASTTSGPSGTLQLSAQFNTCTGCHRLLDPSDPAGNAPTSSSGHSVPFNTADVTITDTHFAKLVTFFSNTATIAGYAMDFSRDSVCTDCHNPHGTAEINREWAASAHGDKGPAQRYFSSAWTRINWTCDGTDTPGCVSSRTLPGTTSDYRRCQRCHTSTGFIEFIDALRTGETQTAVNRMMGLTSAIAYTTAGWKPEMIKCNGCHTDFKGTVRNPGAFTANYDFFDNTAYLATGVVRTVFAQGVNHAYPDAGSSNICVACHSGRENGDTLKALNDSDPAVAPNTFDFSNRGMITSHDLTGGGTLFRGIGYEFDDRSYENNSDYLHDKIGTTATRLLFPFVDTGTSGPCIGCHMSRPNKSGNHLFMPVTRAPLSGTAAVSKASATITAIASQVCFKCHGPNAEVVLDLVKEQKLLYAEAAEAVISAMELSDLYERDGSFYRVRDLSVISAGTASATPGSVDILGKSTNWVNAIIEPGDQLRFDNDSTWYTIAGVASATSLTLTAPYTGVTDTQANYVIKKAETVLVTNGSVTVTGNNTNWSTLLAAGDRFRIDSNGTWYTIATVVDDGTLTLSSPYAGSTTFSPTAGFSLRKNATASVSSSVTVTITGANPLQLDVASRGDYFRVDGDGTWYQINARTATTLTLSSAYTNTLPAAAFTIIRSAANRNWLVRGDTDLTGNTTGKNTMGAAFNLVVLDADPAGYVHNRYYMKRLLYDAIDWFDDGSMNYSAGTTLLATCSGAATDPEWCQGAITYLLPNGVVNGAAAERP